MEDQSWLPPDLEREVLALAALPIEARDSALQALCASAPQHADELRVLAALVASATSPSTSHPTQIGPYHLLSTLGEGGMGTVYLAEQRTPVQRQVALKLIKLGMDSKQVVARFESERQTLASLNHPHIAQIYDGGLSPEGRPYFAMEYVQGEPINRFCESHQLGLRQRIELFRDVCAGVQHAHQRGVLHRDLKPTNLLVAYEDSAARAKIIDFGLARAVEPPDSQRTLLTLEGQMLGTPGYISPEQADPRFAPVDTRTDVYSLGVVLYELLVGKLPFDPGSMREVPLSELQRRILEDEPIRPSSRAAALAKTADEPPVPWLRDLRGDLDWIVLRCLEKEPDRRYRGPAALSDDLARFLDSEPVEARPPTRVYRIRKLVRRQRGLFVSIGLVFLVLVGGIVGTGLGLSSALDANVQLEEQRALARRKAEDAERALERANEVKRVLVDMLALTNPMHAGGRDTTLLRMVVDRTAARLFDGSIADPVIRAELHGIVADVYFNLAAWNSARRHHQAIVELADRADHPPELGPAAAQVVESLLELVRIETMTGDAERARASLDKARAAIEGVLPPGHLLVLESRLREAQLLDRLADPGALDQAREVVAAAQRQLGRDARLTVEAMRFLAPLEHHAGHPEVAAQLQREVEELLAERHGPESGPVQMARAARLDLLEEGGDPEEALELARQVHASFVTTFGADNPRTRGAEGAVGRQLARLGRLGEALPILERYFALEQRVIGAERALLMRTASMLASGYLELGRAEDALELEQRIVAAMTGAYGPDDEDTLFNRANVGVILHALGRDDEVVDLLTDVRERAVRSHGADASANLHALRTLGRAFLALGRSDDACAVFEELLAARRRTSGGDQRLVEEAVELLTQAYESAGRHADAARLRGG